MQTNTKNINLPNSQKNRIPNSMRVSTPCFFSARSFKPFFKSVKNRLSAEPAVSYPELLLAKTCNGNRKRIEIEDGITNDEDEFEAFIKVNAPRENPDKLYKCTKGMLWGQTTKNNYYKIVTCGKDWCSDCGKMHSIPHDRRIDKVFPRLETLMSKETVSIQYLVITVPYKLRELFKSQDVLNKFRTYWRRKLKREGHARGVMRYHWAGEDGYTYKPHLNILMEGGYLQRSVLFEWRKELAQWFKKEFKLSFLPSANIYTSFTNDTGKLKHWASYVLRPTQTIWNPETEQIIKGFRNTSVFGENWPPIEETEEQIKAKATSGYEIDPETGEQEKIIWQKKWSETKERYVPEVIPINHIRTDDLQIVGRGFWKEPKHIPEFEIFEPPPEPDKKPIENLILSLDFCPF